MNPNVGRHTQRSRWGFSGRSGVLGHLLHPVFSAGAVTHQLR
jgi:hypothetical protein